VAQIFVSAVAHFFVVVGGSKIHERLAHFFIDIYNFLTVNVKMERRQKSNIFLSTIPICLFKAILTMLYVESII
jgi:uncharacterized membrane protein YjdF